MVRLMASASVQMMVIQMGLWTELRRSGSTRLAHVAELTESDLVMLKADMMVTVGLQLRKPRDGHEQWEDWVTEWRAYCVGATSDAQRTFAIYALRWEDSEDVSTQLLNLSRSGGRSLIFASAVFQRSELKKVNVLTS